MPPASSPIRSAGCSSSGRWSTGSRSACPCGSPPELYGVLLWVFALYVMAHLIAGNPPFLGFTGITWVALVGHVLFALVAAAIVRWRDREEEDF